MRVALIQTLNPESEGLKLNRFNVDYNRGGRNPLGLAYLAAVLLRAEHEVIIIDRASDHYKSNFSTNKTDAITIDRLRNFLPQIIGISSLTGTVSDAIHLASLIRSQSIINDTLIVFGGFHPTVEDESVLDECPEVDLVLKGEAEYSFLALANGERHENIEGATLRKQGVDSKYFSNPLPANRYDLDQLPFPARHLLDMDYYTKANSAAVPGLHVEPTTFISSRGCPFKCRFCGAKRMNTNVRSHSAEYVIREIEHVLDCYSVNCIIFADQMFLTDNKRVEKFCDLIISKGLNKNICWTANSRVDFVNKQILEYMREAGCIWICYGFESGSQRVLDLANKKTRVEQNVKTALMTKEAGILVSASMIAGLPGETEEDFKQSVEFLDVIQPHAAGFNLFTPLPGTDYYFDFIHKGLIDNNRDWRQLGMLNVEKTISYSEVSKNRLKELMQEANQHLSRASNKTYYEYNYLKNPQQSRIRLSYNSEKAMMYCERPYLMYNEALKSFSEKDYQSADSFVRKAIDARPCLMPCPCPTGCSFYYDAIMLMARILICEKKYNAVFAILDELNAIRNLPYNRGPVFSLIGEAYRLSGNKNEYKLYNEKSNELFANDLEHCRGLSTSVPEPGSCLDIVNLPGWRLLPFEGACSVVEDGRIIFDCRPDDDALLAESPLILIPGNNIKFYYSIMVAEGCVRIVINDLHNRPIVVRKHCVSCSSVLNIDYELNSEIKIQVYASMKSQTKFINIELSDLMFCHDKFKILPQLKRFCKKHS